VGAPVRDYTGRIIAAISVSGDSRVISRGRDAEVAALVLETAAEISARMGFKAKGKN
jgi:DNA-binding IclR family transcriptional regulator